MHKYFPKTFKHTVMCEVEFALTSVFSNDKHQQLQNVFCHNIKWNETAYVITFFLSFSMLKKNKKKTKTIQYDSYFEAKRKRIVMLLLWKFPPGSVCGGGSARGATLFAVLKLS